MNWELTFASDWRKTETVQINTISDLERLYHKYDSELIVNFEERRVTVYDGYIE